MWHWAKIRLFWGLLTIFWLFAVYSTSIWKSFDQGISTVIRKDLDTVKAFNTFLNETIIQTTSGVIAKQTQLALPELHISTWNQEAKTNSSGAFVAEASPQPQLPQLTTLDADQFNDTPLVWHSKKTVKIRDNYYYFSKQVRGLIASIIIAFILYFIPISRLRHKKVIWTMLIWVTLFQLLVFVPWVAGTYNTARGRVNLPWLPNMQPSEFFKIGYIFFMGYRISKRKAIIDTKEFLVQFASINAIVFLVLLCIPDFWTIFILALSATIMARYNWFSLKNIWILGGAALLILAVWSTIIGLLNSKYSYALTRLTTFMTTDAETKKDQEKGVLWQIKQGLIAVWGGGLLGQGYGKGLQKMGYLPESHSDMIFDAFSEEIWFVWNLVLLSLYLWLFYNVLKGLSNVKDPYLQLVGVWLISLLTIQVFVHIGVNLQILPNTGLTLPFVSHWWTALMINFIELMLMYKIIQNR